MIMKSVNRNGSENAGTRKRGRPEPGRLERGMARRVVRESMGVSAAWLSRITGHDVVGYEKGWDDPELDRVYRELEVARGRL